MDRNNIQQLAEKIREHLNAVGYNLGIDTQSLIAQVLRIDGGLDTAQNTGPRWVRANEANRSQYPKHTVFIRYNEGKDKEVGNFSLITELIENGWPDVEYLDETVPQPLPAEEGEAALKAKLDKWVSDSIAVSEAILKEKGNSGLRVLYLNTRIRAFKDMKAALSVIDQTPATPKENNSVSE